MATPTPPKSLATRPVVKASRGGRPARPVPPAEEEEKRLPFGPPQDKRGNKEAKRLRQRNRPFGDEELGFIAEDAADIFQWSPLGEECSFLVAQFAYTRPQYCAAYVMRDRTGVPRELFPHCAEYFNLLKRQQGVHYLLFKSYCYCIPCAYSQVKCLCGAPGETSCLECYDPLCSKCYGRCTYCCKTVCRSCAGPGLAVCEDCLRS